MNQGAGLPIGEALKRTRTQQSLDIRTVEERTKIRIKYLRALENEEWDVLPGPAYVMGFLRTYAQFLGLDAGALVDEYRRIARTSVGSEHPYSFGEPLLERRLRPGEEPRRRWRLGWPAVAVLGATAVVVLLILGLTGGSGNSGKHHHKGKQHSHRHHHGGGPKDTPPQSSGSSHPITLSLTTRDDMQVCLVAADGRTLIDSQTLISGAKEGPFQPPADRYRLDLDSGGALSLNLNGNANRVHSRSPASFVISALGIQPTDFKGPNCP